MSELFVEKSLLSKLMAEENIIVEQKAVKTASFNLNSRVLTIPTFKETVSAEILDVLFSHEISHAIYTKKDLWFDATREKNIPKAILNVVEDARIEKLIKRKYPGLKNSYIKGYNELIEMGFFGEEVKSGQIEKYNFLDKLNLFFKIGHIRNYEYNFNEIESDILHKVSNVETMEQVISISEEILKYFEESEEKKTFLEEGFGDCDIGEYEFEPFHEIDGKEIEYIDSDLEVRSEIDEIFKNMESELYSDSCIGYIDVGSDTSENSIIDFTRIIKILRVDEYEIEKSENFFLVNFKRKSNNVVNYLLKEFELKKNADRFKKSKISKTGDLCSKKLYSYKYDENIFNKINIVPDAKSHGLIFFIDWSGSMVKILQQTIEQLMNLVLFCKKASIPYEVYAFTSRQFPSIDIRQKQVEKSKYSKLMYNKSTLLNLLSSRMTNSEFSGMANFLLGLRYEFREIFYHNIKYRRYDYLPHWLALESTPLNECIVNAIDIVNQFKRTKNLQIVNTIFLTDGEGNYPYILDAETSKGVFMNELVGRNFIRNLKYKEQVSFNNLINESVQKTCFNITKSFIELFKKCTKSNLIGFYIVDGGCSSLLNCLYNHDPSIVEEYNKQYIKTGCVAIHNTGYDEYYLIRNKKLNLVESELDFSQTNTIRGMASKFAKHLGKKIDSRIILEKFVKKIS